MIGSEQKHLERWANQYPAKMAVIFLPFVLARLDS